MDLRSWLNSRPPKLGTLLTLDNPAIIEIARIAGFDWLWIDAEHGQFDERTAATACAINSGGPPAFVRLPDFAPTTIKRFLDTGCDGIILPAVSTIEDVRAIARAALYPPHGQRSVGIARAQGYGTNFTEYLREKSYSIVVQIETTAGVENAREIVAHQAVDAVILGPYDLSGSFGIPGEVDAPQVVNAIATVLSLCKQARKPCGIFSATAESAHAYAAQGFDMIAVGIDTTALLNAYKSILTATR
jgi:2-dehydro-3-deoxyglucarate aldolase/4-hydroxy-2-oxoheptanedioate aldolase